MAATKVNGEKRNFIWSLTDDSNICFSLPDLFVLLFFGIVTFVMFMYLWAGVAPELTITGDAANIASFAAAIDHPDLFTGDELLENHENFGFYKTIHIPVIRWLGKFSGGYGNAFMRLSWLHMFLQAAGFYLLGCVIFRVRIWAAIFSFVALWFGIILVIGEFWGIYKDPLPRVSFQALLPFLLAACYYWRDKPARWPWLMGAAGLLMYVHPVSTPAWGLALWCGFVFYLPGHWSVFKKLLYMIFIGFAFLIVTGPYLLIYLGNHSHGAVVSYDEVHSIMVSIFNGGILDVPYAVMDFIYTISFKFGHGSRMMAPALLLPGAICGFAYLKKFKRKDAGSYKIILGWLFGLLLACAVLPFAEQEICRRFRMIPLELDLIRGLRYIVPLCMLFCVWPLAEYYKKCESEITRKRILIIGIVAAVSWAAMHLPPPVARRVYQSVVSRQFIPCVTNQGELKEVMDFIRDELPPGSRVFPPRGRLGVAVRYYALKPVVFCEKDRGAFAYANHSRLLEWNDTMLRVNSIQASPSAQDRLDGLMELAADHGADYLFVNYDAAQINHDKTKGKLVFRNTMYSVFILHNDSLKEH